MEFKLDPGSEPDLVDELRQAQIAGGRKPADHKVERWAWWKGWVVGWPLAKTAAMNAEKDVQQFAVPWAEAWARAKARASAEGGAMVAGLVGEKEANLGVADALLLGEGLGEVRVQARGGRVPDGLTDPPTIADILTSTNRYAIAHHTWDDSLERERNIGVSYNSLHPSPAFRSSCSIKSFLPLSKKPAARR